MDGDLLRKAAEKWGTIEGLLLALAVCFLASLAGSSWADRFGILLILFVPVFAVWSQARWQWWGRWRKGKIRILVGIYCAEPSIEAQIEEDFTRELRALIKHGNLGRDVLLVQATRAECKEAEGSSDLARLMLRKNAHFLVYGRVKKRLDGQSQSLYMSLRAAVRHTELQAQVKRNFSEEMSSVFPSGMLKIPINEQLPQLKITADWVAVSTRYILSMAAGVSGDLDYAEQMLADALELVPNLSNDVARRTKLRGRLLARINELNRAQIGWCYSKWRKSRSREDALHLKSYLEKALAFSKHDARLKQMLATTNFILTADAVTAERELQAAIFDDPAVYASLAFVFAMQGKYAAARKAYRSAWKRKPTKDVIEQTTSFFKWFKDAYPAFYNQTLWCEAAVIHFLDGPTDEYRKIIGFLVRSSEAMDADEMRLLQQAVA